MCNVEWLSGLDQRKYQSDSKYNTGNNLMNIPPITMPRKQNDVKIIYGNQITM